MLVGHEIGPVFLSPNYVYESDVERVASPTNETSVQPNVLTLLDGYHANQLANLDGPTSVESGTSPVDLCGKFNNPSVKCEIDNSSGSPEFQVVTSNTDITRLVILLTTDSSGHLLVSQDEVDALTAILSGDNAVSCMQDGDFCADSDLTRRMSGPTVNDRVELTDHINPTAAELALGYQLTTPIGKSVEVQPPQSANETSTKDIEIFAGVILGLFITIGGVYLGAKFFTQVTEKFTYPDRFLKEPKPKKGKRGRNKPAKEEPYVNDGDPSDSERKLNAPKKERSAEETMTKLGKQVKEYEKRYRKSGDDPSTATLKAIARVRWNFEHGGAMAFNSDAFDTEGEKKLEKIYEKLSQLHNEVLNNAVADRLPDALSHISSVLGSNDPNNYNLPKPGDNIRKSKHAWQDILWLPVNYKEK